MKADRIIFNVPEDIKKEFKETCDSLGMNMTNVMISLILQFNKDARKSPNKK